MASFTVFGSSTGLGQLQALHSLRIFQSFKRLKGEKEPLKTLVTFATFIANTEEDSKIHSFSVLRVTNTSQKNPSK